MDKKPLLSEILIKHTLLNLNHTCEAEIRYEKDAYSEMIAEIVKSFAEIEILRELGGTPDAAIHAAKVKALSQKAQQHRDNRRSLEMRLQAIEKLEDKPGKVINAINAFPDEEEPHPPSQA